MQPHADGLLRQLRDAPQGIDHLRDSLHTSIIQGGAVGGLVAGLIVVAALCVFLIFCRKPAAPRGVNHP